MLGDSLLSIMLALGFCVALFVVMLARRYCLSRRRRLRSQGGAPPQPQVSGLQLKTLPLSFAAYPGYQYGGVLVSPFISIVMGAAICVGLCVFLSVCRVVVRHRFAQPLQFEATARQVSTQGI